MTALQGRTVALVGLERAELLDASGAIETAGGDWQAFGRAPDAAKLRVFDVVICRAAMASELAGAGVPLLVAGQADVDGAHDFIVTPIRAEELVLRVQRLVDVRPELPRAPVHETPVILTADDDPTTTAIVRAVVTQNAMTCHVARDGREAVESARELVPDAMVLDVNMPFRDGFEVLSALRSDPRTATIPVLMLTSVQQEVDVVKGFRLGADDYVVKPFNPMELLARIKRLVRKA
ncbi:MAG TPA: response regulator [Thermoanaerobaculia bacterium]|nr:response regulator [Thermoanaerobaculia bacterium]